MQIIHESFAVNTKHRNEMVDITSQVQSIIRQAKISTGDCIVYCPHTTAAITINENADPSVVHDILMTLEDLLPKNRKGYLHSEGNSDSHVKSSLFGYSEQIIFKDNTLMLGTWQGIYFCEFDGPRSRKVYLQIRGE